MSDIIDINVSEEDSVNVTVRDNIIYLSKDSSFYNIEFQNDDTSIWAIFSKFTGQITGIELINVSSYKIDGSTVTLPFTVEFNRAYLIEIVKANPSLDASIKFETIQTAFTENIELPDFSIGNGHITYGLSSVENCLYKIDNTKLTISNTSGVGTWADDPLEDTIPLPVLSSGAWNKLIFLKNGKLLIAGSDDGVSANKYFCYLTENGIITDLSGNTGSYTTLMSLKKYGIYGGFYNYIDDYVYFLDYTGGDNLFRLDLNTNILTQKDQVGANLFLNSLYRKKNFFNPYKKVFISTSEIDFESEKTGLYIFFNRPDYKKCFNRNTGYYICSQNNDYKRTYVIDQFSRTIAYFWGAGTGSYPVVFHINLDHDNNVYLASSKYNYFVIVRINDVNHRAFTLQHPESGQSQANNGMFAYGNLSLLLSDLGGRLFCIDTSDPNSGSAPDFNYYDFPQPVVDIYTNRLL